MQPLRRCKSGLSIIRAQHLGRKVLLHEQRLSLREGTAQARLHPAGTVRRRQDCTTKEYPLYQGETKVLFDGNSLRGVANKGQSPQTGAPLFVRVVVTDLRRQREDAQRRVLLTNLTDSISEAVRGYLAR